MNQIPEQIARDISINLTVCKSINDESLEIHKVYISRLF